MNTDNQKDITTSPTPWEQAVVAIKANLEMGIPIPEVSKKTLAAGWDEVATNKLITEAIQQMERQKSVSKLLADFVGQDAIKEDLHIRINHAIQNKVTLPHLLLCGPQEMGKATLAQAIANELRVNIQFSSADNLRKGDLGAILTNLRPGDLAVIEKIELLKEPALESLIEVLSSNHFPIVVGKGPSARSMILPLPPFTFVGTTSTPWQIDKRIHRWLIKYDFASYDLQQIATIIISLGNQHKLSIAPDAALLLARQCGSSLGNAAVLIKRIAKLSSTDVMRRITLETANNVLTELGYSDKPVISTDIATHLRGMNGIEFEQFVADLFRKQGYTVETTKISGDHGIDLLMHKENKLTAVQCKRWSDAVGEPVIRDFLGALTNTDAQFGYVVTTSSFTAQAYTFIQNKPILLIDLDALIRLVNESSKTD